MRIELKAPVEAQRLVPIELKPALTADQCDSCGFVFEMKGRHTGKRFAELHGIFDRCVNGEDGRNLGNMFSATVCSFQCAHRIFAEDGWKALPGLALYAQAGASIEWAEVIMAADRTSKEDLIRAWEDAPERPVVRASTVGFVSR